MLKQTITELLTQAIVRAQNAGKLPTVTLPEIVIERPQNPEHGDYASSISLKLARAVGIKPLAIASDVVSFIAPSPEIASVTVAPPSEVTIPPPVALVDVIDVTAEVVTEGRVISCNVVNAISLP